jgi:hypothetical protein
LGRFGPFRYFTKLDAKLAELAPITHKFAKRSCVGHKTYVLARFGPFRYCTKVDAKLAELALLMQKYAKRSCVGIVHNKRNRSIPFNPKLMFWGVLDRFMTARKLMQNWPN